MTHMSSRLHRHLRNPQEARNSRSIDKIKSRVTVYMEFSIFPKPLPTTTVLSTYSRNGAYTACPDEHTPVSLVAYPPTKRIQS